MPVKLSVVIIIFNEEKNIGRCLDSVMGLADPSSLIALPGLNGLDQIAPLPASYQALLNGGQGLKIILHPKSRAAPASGI
jgi:hypothetical protein